MVICKLDVDPEKVRYLKDTKRFSVQTGDDGTIIQFSYHPDDMIEDELYFFQFDDDPILLKKSGKNIHWYELYPDGEGAEDTKDGEGEKEIE